jgi:hypothetical protein
VDGLTFYVISVHAGGYGQWNGCKAKRSQVSDRRHGRHDPVNDRSATESSPYVWSDADPMIEDGADSLRVRDSYDSHRLRKLKER